MLQANYISTYTTAALVPTALIDGTLIGISLGLIWSGGAFIGKELGKKNTLRARESAKLLLKILICAAAVESLFMICFRKQLARFITNDVELQEHIHVIMLCFGIENFMEGT
jgi:Na+-driven multidrug efflux pump